MFFDHKRFIVLTGNYGSGKTEISLNLALQSAQIRSTTIVDLDIVNPYFRTGEKASVLQEAGIRVLMRLQRSISRHFLPKSKAFLKCLPTGSFSMLAEMIRELRHSDAIILHL